MIEMTYSQVVDALIIARGLTPRLTNEKELMRHKMNKRREIEDKEYELNKDKYDIVDFP